jgi:ribulose-phosphate 3-epimerase
MNKVEIIPAILPRDFTEISDKVEILRGATDQIQIDVCDGHFVPSFTWPYKKHDDSFEKMLTEDIGLPDWQDIDYEFDLMVDNPEKVVDDWIQVGASRIVIHAESKGDLFAVFQKMNGKVDMVLALNIDTPIEKIGGWTSEVGPLCIQLMGIARIGYQGQSFDDRVISKIKEVRAKYPEAVISIDGGVSLDNAAQLIEAGANRLVVGSAIWNSDNPLETLAKLKEI